jgi:hypothetical protein
MQIYVCFSVDEMKRTNRGISMYLTINVNIISVLKDIWSDLKALMYLQVQVIEVISDSEEPAHR